MIENEFEVLALGAPLCAMLRRRAAWLSAGTLAGRKGGGVSITEAVKVKVPKAVGEPVMAPVAVLDKLSPGGSEHLHNNRGFDYGNA